MIYKALRKHSYFASALLASAATARRIGTCGSLFENYKRCLTLKMTKETIKTVVVILRKL